MSTKHIVHRIIEPGLPGDGFTNAEATQVRAGVERVDPGSTGLVGQYLTMGPDGPSWLADPVLNVRHPRFGAVADNVTDDTAAIQAAIDLAKTQAMGGTIFLPNGQYRIEGTLDLAGSGLTIAGESRTATGVWKDTPGTLFSLDGVSNFVAENMYISTVNGHMFDATKSIYHAAFRDLRLKQYGNNYSIFHLDDTLSGRTQADYVDNLWTRVESIHELTATVPTFSIRSYAANRNRFIDMRPTYSGNYHWLIESTHQAGARAIGNVWEGITGEVLNGGGIKMLGGMGTRISDFDFWDFQGTINNHLIVLDQSNTNGTKYTTHTTISNTRNIDGTYGSGIHDVFIGDGDGGGNTMTTLMNCGGYGPLKVRNRGRIVQINGDVSYTALGNITRITGGSSYFGGTTGLPAYTTASRPAANSVGAGTMIYDTTLGKPIWSNNANWRDANGTIV